MLLAELAGTLGPWWSSGGLSQEERFGLPSLSFAG